MNSTATLPPIIASLVRHGLTALAGMLVARGYLNPSSSNGMAEFGTGILVGLIGFGWSLARAGKLGQQARTICQLADKLLEARAPEVTGGVVYNPPAPAAPPSTWVGTEPGSVPWPTEKPA